jgi:hypothetical protein
VKRYGKCEKIWNIWKKSKLKMWNDMENMEERQFEIWYHMENMEERQVE